MKKLISIGLLLLILSTSAALVFTYTQISQNERHMYDDLQRHTSLLAHSISYIIVPHLQEQTPESLQSLVQRFETSTQIGVALFDTKGDLLVVTPSSPDTPTYTQSIALSAMDTHKETGMYETIKGKRYYLYAIPLSNNAMDSGSLAIMFPADAIDAQIQTIWRYNIIRVSLQAALLILVLLFFARWFIILPVKALTSSIQAFRKGNESTISLPNSWFFHPLANELNFIKKTLMDARQAASYEAKLRLEKLETPWTEHRLQEFIKATVKGREFFVVSNREPYMHVRKGSEIIVQQPASGMITALEPIMQACKGTWVAHGSGSADKEVVDARDTIRIPPDEPKYTLKRIWLTPEQEQGYYNGFSNEGIWPLCHMAHTRPIFRKEDWEQYKTVNEMFARAVLQEIKSTSNPIILIQDYHFSLLPQLIKAKRPDALVAIFWHIPWSHAEAFRICPWRKEMLEGLLGADLIGFHIQLHCNNFLDTVSNELESLINWEQFSITKHGHVSHIKPFPISISFSNPNDHESADISEESIRENLGISAQYIGIGVDRLDYTKGILERLRAVDILFEKHPEYIGTFTFLQIAAPTRSEIKSYHSFAQNVQDEVERINKKYQTKTWSPIIFQHRLHSHRELSTLYKLASVCLVTSLHDGMNLVAKEFIAARDDEQGVMILSQFTGASQELKDALIINPYNEEETAEAIHRALTMQHEEQKRRMKRMRETVLGYNIYRWSAELLKSMVTLG